MKKQLFALLLLGNIFSLEAKFDTRTLLNNNMEDTEWMYMEKVFINDISGAKRGQWKRVQKYIQTAILSFLGYKWIESHKNETFSVSDFLNKGTLYLAGTCFTAQEIMLPYLQKHLEGQASTNHLVKFLNDWDTNKEYTPLELHAQFEELVTILNTQGKEEIAKVASSVISTMEFVVKRYFEHRFMNNLDPREQAPSLKYEKSASKLLTEALKSAKSLI